MPHSIRDCLRDQFSILDKGSMTVTEYEAYFHELARMQLLFWTMSIRRFIALLEGLDSLFVCLLRA